MLKRTPTNVSLLGLSLILAFLTGCASPSGTTLPSTAISASSAGKITLLTGDTTFGDPFTTYIENAEKITGINIEVIASPTNFDDRQIKVTTILASGDESIDILALNDEMVSAFKSKNFLEPVQDTVLLPEVLKNYPVDYIEQMLTYDGRIYSVPMYMEVLAMWINEKKLQETGLPVPATKQEFLDFIKAATVADSYGYGGSWDKTYVYNELGTFVNLFGGDYYDWTNPNTIAAAKFLYDLAADGYTPKTQVADFYDPMMQKFIDGKYGVILMYTGALQTFIASGKYGPDGIHLIPMPAFANKSAYIATWQYALNAASKNKSSAIVFMQYAASAEGSKAYFEMSHRLPARLDVLNAPDFHVEDLEIIRDYLNNTTLRGRPMVPQSVEFISSMGNLFQKYVFDEITLKQFCERAQIEVNKYTK